MKGGGGGGELVFSFISNIASPPTTTVDTLVTGMLQSTIRPPKVITSFMDDPYTVYTVCIVYYTLAIWRTSLDVNLMWATGVTKTSDVAWLCALVAHNSNKDSSADFFTLNAEANLQKFCII